jgi:hypothetical protein
MIGKKIRIERIINRKQGDVLLYPWITVFPLARGGNNKNGRNH